VIFPAFIFHLRVIVEDERFSDEQDQMPAYASASSADSKSSADISIQLACFRTSFFSHFSKIVLDVVAIVTLEPLR
jgi:hypothetical protein